MIRIFFVCSITIVLLSCSVNKIKNSSASGKFTVALRVCDNLTKKMDTMPYMSDPNIWYKDSLIIEEVFYTQFYQNDTTHEQTWKSLPYEYTFIDLPNRAFYVFSSFSDTAKFVRKYTQPDSVQGTLWNFWGVRAGSELKESKAISDTLVDGINYQRFNTKVYGLNRERKMDTATYILYMSCNLDKPKMITLHKSFSQLHNNCTVTRMECYNNFDSYSTVFNLQYLANSLTEKEEKIFKAWAKYAKEHPLKK